ncbi:MAG: glutamine-hydrolyzing carbamoyl-phosphate synthase small subunit [Mycoplasmatales bacterium]
MKLILENGKVFKGNAFGAKLNSSEIAEVIFTTSMTGYQEVITDPSYYKQMVVLSYPLVGNYGLNDNDFESSLPYLSALIVNNYNDEYSHCDATKSLSSYLEQHNVVGLEGVDTRELTKVIRDLGSVRGQIVNDEVDEAKVIKQLKKWKYNKHVSDVSTKSKYVCPGKGHRIVLVDCGSKKHIIQKLTERDCEVTVVPYNTTYEEIKSLNPDGILFSNGPGDPKDVKETIELFKQVDGVYPTFGICLGHQIFGLSRNFETKKMKFGHHSSNHPVLDIKQDTIHITTQNHGYEVVYTKDKDVFVSHKSLNDNTVEGLESRNNKTFTVQFHPEGNQGPTIDELFEKFLKEVEEVQNAVK